MKKESVGRPIRGIARKLLLVLEIYLMCKEIQQNAKREKIVDKIERIMDEVEDIEYMIRKLESLRYESDNTEESSLEELKARLMALEGEEPCISEFEEPVATRIDFEDEIFTFMSEIDLCEEDEQLIRIATNHPLYKSFAKTYCRHEPEASELQTVRAFVRTMALPIEEEEEPIELVNSPTDNIEELLSGKTSEELVREAIESFGRSLKRPKKRKDQENE